jgi:hypothetical protein
MSVLTILPCAAICSSYNFIKTAPHNHGHRDHDCQHDPQPEAFRKPVSPPHTAPYSEPHEPDTATVSSEVPVS